MTTRKSQRAFAFLMSAFISTTVSFAQDAADEGPLAPYHSPKAIRPETLVVPITQPASPGVAHGWVLTHHNRETASTLSNPRVERTAVRLHGSGGSSYITWEVRRTTNSSCTSEAGDPCPDTIHVRTVPDGFVAVPETAVVNERETKRILIVPSGLS